MIKIERKRVWWAWALAGGCWIWGGGAGIEQLSRAQAEAAERVTVPVARAIEQATWSELASQAQPREISLPAVEQRQRELAQRIRELEQYLHHTAPANAARWKSFLKWDGLQAMVTAKPGELPEDAQQVAAQFYSGEAGLELPKFRAVRDAISRYAALVGARRQTLTEAFADRQTALVSALQDYERESTSVHRARLIEQIAWFETLEQIPHLTTSLRNAHQQPNLMIRISEGMVSRAVSRDVYEVQPVRDTILKTQVSGTSTTVGRVSASLIPHPSKAGINLLLNGRATTPSIGHQKPVQICSTSHTDIHACQALFLDYQGAQLGGTDAQCRTTTQIHSISAGDRLASRLIEKVAWKRAAEQKPLSERIASGKAEARVERMFRNQSQPLVAQANARLGGEVRRPLVRRNLYPRQVAFHTTDDAIYGMIQQVTARQWGARTRPPVIEHPADLLVQIHESMINNSAETAISGYRLTNDRADELMQELTGKPLRSSTTATGANDESGEEGSADDPWSITFAVERPLQVSFEGDVIEIAVQGRQFTRGDRVLNQPMRISARYRHEVTPQGLRLERIENVEVVFSGREGEQLGVREIPFKKFMEGRWEEIFKPEIQGEGLELPGRLAQMGRKKISSVSVRSGWLSLGWN